MQAGALPSASDTSKGSSLSCLQFLENLTRRADAGLAWGAIQSLGSSIDKRQVWKEQGKDGAHRIMEWFGWQGMLKLIQSHPLPLDQAAPTPSQRGLGVLGFGSQAEAPQPPYGGDNSQHPPSIAPFHPSTTSSPTGLCAEMEQLPCFSAPGRFPGDMQLLVRLRLKIILCRTS